MNRHATAIWDAIGKSFKCHVQVPPKKPHIELVWVYDTLIGWFSGNVWSCEGHTGISAEQAFDRFVQSGCRSERESWRHTPVKPGYKNAIEILNPDLEFSRPRFITERARLAYELTRAAADESA